MAWVLVGSFVYEFWIFVWLPSRVSLSCFGFSLSNDRLAWTRFVGFVAHYLVSFSLSFSIDSVFKAYILHFLSYTFLEFVFWNSLCRFKQDYTLCKLTPHRPWPFTLITWLPLCCTVSSEGYSMPPLTLSLLSCSKVHCLLMRFSSAPLFPLKILIMKSCYIHFISSCGCLLNNKFQKHSHCFLGPS